MIDPERERNSWELQQEGFYYDSSNSIWVKVEEEFSFRLPLLGDGTFVKVFLKDPKGTTSSLAERFENENYTLGRDIKPFPFIPGNRYLSEVTIALTSNQEDYVSTEFSCHYNPPKPGEIVPNIMIKNPAIGQATYNLEGKLLWLILFAEQDTSLSFNMTSGEIIDDNEELLVDFSTFKFGEQRISYQGNIFVPEKEGNNLKVTKIHQTGKIIGSISAPVKIERMDHALNTMFDTRFDRYGWMNILAEHLPVDIDIPVL